jgi:hypothetical protein
LLAAGTSINTRAGLFKKHSELLAAVEDLVSHERITLEILKIGKKIFYTLPVVISDF